MTIRKNISLSDERVIQVFEEKVKCNKASSFIQECVLFYLQYNSVISEVTDASNLINLMKGGVNTNEFHANTTQKKKNRIGGLLK